MSQPKSDQGEASQYVSDLDRMTRQISFHEALVDQVAFDPLPFQSVASNVVSTAPSAASAAVLALATQRSNAGSFYDPGRHDVGTGRGIPCSSLTPLDGQIGVVSLDTTNVTRTQTQDHPCSPCTRVDSKADLQTKQSRARSIHLKPCRGPVRSPSLPISHTSTSPIPVGSPAPENYPESSLSSPAGEAFTAEIPELDPSLDIIHAIQHWRTFVAYPENFDNKQLLMTTLEELQRAVVVARKQVVAAARRWIQLCALAASEDEGAFTESEESLLRQVIEENLLPPTHCINSHSPCQPFTDKKDDAPGASAIAEADGDDEQAIVETFQLFSDGPAEAGVDKSFGLVDAVAAAQAEAEINLARTTKALCEALAALSHVRALMVRGSQAATASHSGSAEGTLVDRSAPIQPSTGRAATVRRLVRDYVLYKILHRSASTTVYLGAQRFTNYTLSLNQVAPPVVDDTMSPRTQSGGLHGSLTHQSPVAFELPTDHPASPSPAGTASSHVMEEPPGHDALGKPAPFVDSLALAFWTRTAAHTDAGIVALPSRPGDDAIVTFTFHDPVTATHATIGAHKWFNPATTLERSILEASVDEGKTWCHVTEIPKHFFKGVDLRGPCGKDTEGYNNMRVLRFPRMVTSSHWRLRLPPSDKPMTTHLLSLAHIGLGRYTAFKRSSKSTVASPTLKVSVPNPLKEYAILTRLAKNPFVVECIDAFSSKSPQTSYAVSQGSQPPSTHEQEAIWVVTNFIEGTDLLACLASHATSMRPSATSPGSPASPDANYLLSTNLQSVARLPESVVKKYAAQLGLGLYHMHSIAGVAHLDVKPANIVLDKQVDRVVFVDFRLARVLEQADESKLNADQPDFISRAQLVELLESNGKTDVEGKDEHAPSSPTSSPPLIAGTAEYGAPEIFAVPQSSGLSASKADMYSLGVTLFQLLTGNVPYQGYPVPTNRAFALLAILGPERYLATRLHLPPPDPKREPGTKRTAGFSAECWDVLEGLLQIDPQKRWSASQLLRHPWLRSELLQIAANL